MLNKNGCTSSLDAAETLNYKAYSCPHCAASDRDRLYALYISNHINKFKTSNVSMLEVAPSKPLTAYLKQIKNISVRTADLMMQGVDDHVDITNMACYPDGVFDFFICSHVLEHVSDDLKAMRELYRVLKPSGWGILMVPIFLTVDQIDEDASEEDVGERWRRFGQDDHVRMYSKKGFVERVEVAGFTVRQYGLEYFGLDAFKTHGISEKSILYIVEKPVGT